MERIAPYALGEKKKEVQVSALSENTIFSSTSSVCKASFENPKSLPSPSRNKTVTLLGFRGLTSRKVGILKLNRGHLSLSQIIYINI